MCTCSSSKSGLDDLGNMCQFKRDLEEMYCGARPDRAVAYCVT